MARRTPQFPKKDDYYFIDRKINGERCHLRSKDPYELEAKYQAWLINREKREEERQRGGYFEDVAALWWAEKEKTIKNGTRICYKPAYARAKEYFGGQRMGEITPDQVAQYIGGLQRKGYAGNTIANHKSVLMMIFDYWRYDPRWKGAKPNPVTGYKLPAGLPKQQRQPPTAEQIAICKANMSHPFGHLIALLIYTGARLNEINALQWKDIDYTTRHIKIYKSVAWVGNRPVIGTPKTKNAVRTIPLLAPLADVLKPLTGEPLSFVLSGSATPLTKDEYAAKWAKFCQFCGLCETNVVEWGKKKKTARRVLKPLLTAHQFRHEFASVLYECGIGELEAQQLLGHADIATTHKIYTHLRQRQMDDAENKLNAYFSQSASAPIEA